MKRLLVSFLAILVIFAAGTPQTVYADPGAKLSGNVSTTEAGKNIQITFTITGASHVTALNGSFSVNGVALTDITSGRSGWTVQRNGNTFTAYDTSGGANAIDGSVAVFTATFQVNKSLAPGSAIGVSVSATSTDGEKTSPSFSTSWSGTVAAPPSSNAKLASLSCVEGALSPAFSADTANYSVTVPYSVKALSLKYTTQDGGAKVAVSGNSLSVGTNTVTVTVTAANGATKSYSIRATRQQDPSYVPPSDNAKLGSLTCGDGTLFPAFAADTTSYSITVPYSVSALSLNYTTQDSGAKVSVSGNSLEVGENTVSVTVTAAKGNTKTYTIRATRQQDPDYVPSNNANLASLTVTTGTLSPAFDPEIKSYVVYLPYEADSFFEVNGTAQDSKAKSVTGSAAELRPGDNPLTVTCVAEDEKTVGEYVVHIYRMPQYAGVLPEIIDPDFADYTAVDAVLANIPADMSLYTEDSASALQNAVDAVVRKYPAEKQAEVDAMAAAIEAALAGLVEAPAPEELTPWQKLCNDGSQTVTLPLVGAMPLWGIGLAALVLLLLLAYLLGSLIGRAAGKRRALRRMQEENTPADTQAQTPDMEEVPSADTLAPEQASDTPAEASAAAQVQAPVSETPVPAEEPAPAEDANTPIPEDVASDTASQTPPENTGESSEPVSLDDLLDDIRNM